MINKVLVKVIVPELNFSYDIFIPVNELIWRVNKLIVKSISDLTGGVLNQNLNYLLLNKDTGVIYHNNKIIIDTDIRNATELILLSTK